MGLPSPFLTPNVDEYSYRLVNLGNGITALIVHDADTDKAAAACDVRVGSLSDPDDLPGLAHFTEHMLFYSSEKYPDEDSYSKFIAEKGGHTNAYTANESTNYHFDCNWDALPDALDRFAQFFVAPLISSDGVDREVNAVDSEHAKNTNSDSWKKLQLWKATANKAHPFSRFATGNKDTLMIKPTAAGISVHDRVRKFHKEHYSAGLMRVVVLGRHSLDEMESMVREKFEMVENRGFKPAQFSDDAVTEVQAGTLIQMVPERDGHSIEIQWPTISEQENYASSPSHYVSFLLGHEGKGSAFALLKMRGWANGLSAGEASTSYSSRSFFMCRVDLTEEGQTHAADVVSIIFAYLALLHGPAGVQEHIFLEMEALARLRFDFRDKLNPYSYVSSLSHGLQVYRPEDLLLAIYSVPLKFDPELICSVVADLSPENARVMWASKALAAECNEVEEWYGTRYSTRPIPEDWTAQWRQAFAQGPSLLGLIDELHLPAPNEFIPSDFSLLKESADVPQCIPQKDSAVKLWMRPDPSFKTPKAVFYLHLHLPEAYASPLSAVLVQLYVRLVNDALSELTYPADVAGLGYSLRSSVPGILLTFSGYHHTLPLLVKSVLSAVIETEVLGDRFEIAAEKLSRDFANMKFEQPYQLALYDLAVAMEVKRFHIDDYETILPQLAAADLATFLPRLFSRCRIEAFCAGNIPVGVAQDLVAAALTHLRERHGSQTPSPSQCHEARVVKLVPGRPALLRRLGPNVANENSAVVVAYQVGPDSARTNALSELLVHIGKRDAFYQLRTVEQLGYLTFCSTYWTLTACTVAFIVQSSVKDAAYLEARVEAFLPKLRDRLVMMPDEEFAAQVNELVKAKLEKPKRLREVAAKNWKEIDDGTMRFKREEEEVAELKMLSPADLLLFFNEVLGSPASRRKFAVHVQSGSCCGQVQAAKNGVDGTASIVTGTGGAVDDSGPLWMLPVDDIDDVFSWKRRQELYPSFR